MTADELLKILAQVPPDRLRQIVATVQASPAAPSTPKLSRALDAIAVQDVDDIVKACEAGIEISDKHHNHPDRELRALAPLQQVSPQVAHACQANSVYRRKDIAHSLRTTVRYLETIHGPAARPQEPVVTRSVRAAEPDKGSSSDA